MWHFVTSNTKGLIFSFVLILYKSFKGTDLNIKFHHLNLKKYLFILFYYVSVIFLNFFTFFKPFNISSLYTPSSKHPQQHFDNPSTHIFQCSCIPQHCILLATYRSLFLTHLAAFQFF